MLNNKSPKYDIYLFGNEAGINILFDILEKIFFSKGHKVRRLNKFDYKEILKLKFSLNDRWILGYDSWDELDNLLVFLKKQKVLTFGLLDAWKGLFRFYKSDMKPKEMTDFLFVFDNKLKLFFEEKEIKTQIVVVENPLLNKILNTSKTKRKIIRENTEKKFELDKSKKNLVLISEPISKRIDENFYDYKSIENLSDNNNLLKIIEEKYKDNYNLILRQHPVEKEIDNINWHNANFINEEQTLFLGDLFLGVGSTFLILAKIAGFSIVLVNKLVKWIPNNGNYHSDIWDHVENNLLSKTSDENINNYISKLKIDEFVLST